jgi:Dyp-type peroxidase family
MPLNIYNDHSVTCAEVMANEVSFRAIQGYVLVSHGRDNVWLGLVRFQAPAARQPELRAFLKTFGSKATNSFDLWSGLQQYSEARRQKIDPEELRRIKEAILAPMVTALGLSSSGYRLFPQATPPRFDAFRKGFRPRFPELQRMDAGEPFDAVLVLAANHPTDNHPIDQLRAKQREIDTQLKGLASVHWEHGQFNKNDGNAREPFGFVDGISQPAIFASEDDPNASFWKPFAPLAQVVTREPLSTHADDEYGSLMAFMKIEQNVDAFQSLTKEMAVRCGKTEDEIRSWMVGRSVDGKPLMPTGVGKNDFVYDSDPKFQVCPAAAHIRKANPRTQDAKGVRIIRRGVPYGNGKGPRGLLFQSFGSTLEQTFEFIMKAWLLDEKFPPTATAPGMDPILGNRDASPLPVGMAAGAVARIQSIARIRAGEYFYFPSIPSFGRLDA